MKKTLLAVMALVSLCSYGQLANEGFETPWTSPTPNNPAAPPGWMVINEHGPNVTWVQTVDGDTSQPPFGGNHSAFLNRENTSSTDPTPRDWLITPTFIAPVDGILRFQSRLTIAGDQGSIYKVLISTDSDPANLSSYTALYTATELQINPLQTDYNQVSVNLGNYAGQQVQIAFVMEGDGADRWLIDDVGIFSNCNVPIQPHASLMGNAVELNWTHDESITSWEIEIVSATQAPTGQGIVFSGTPPFTATVDANGMPLAPGEYKYYVRSLCADGGQSVWVGPVYFGLEGFNGTVNGLVKFDSNNDDVCDASDNVLPNTEVQVYIDQVYVYSVYTNGNGEYSLSNLPVLDIAVAVRVIAPEGFEIEPLQPVNFPAGEETLSVEHCLEEIQPGVNLSISLIPSIAARPGLPAEYRLQIANLGTVDMQDVVATVSFNDTRITYDSSSHASTSVSGNIISLTFDEIAASGWKYADLIFNVMMPPVNEGGEILEFEAAFTNIEDDINPANNTAVLNQTIVNSYDPNDITVHEGAEIYEEQADDYLTYTIRFQNMGTAEAIDIEVKNTLDPLLDWDTFEPITSSHSYVVKRTDDKLEFIYKGINLPHEDANEPGSHGFVTYKIKPKAEYGLGDIVSSTAEIYFDFNEAIVTNTATTEVIELLGVDDKQIAVAKLYPNPVKDQLHVAVVLGELQSVTVTDVNGRQCLSSDAETIDTNSLGSGIYFVKVTTGAGSADYKIIKH